MTGPTPGPTRIVVLLKGYPRLSETFIAQELRGLEEQGFALTLVSMRRPTDTKRHPVHDEIVAPVLYLPEYLHQEPLRVLRSLWRIRRAPGAAVAVRRFLADLPRDFSRNRFRRLGQAAVLAAEWPRGGDWIYAHFLHTPASVADYASLITTVPWSASAHAKDIWTTVPRELTHKLGAARWTVTCTRGGADYLRSLAPDPGTVYLSYHGLDLTRFPSPEAGGTAPRAADAPVTVLSVGRAVPKKGFDVLLKALAALPPALDWRFVHVGSGGEQKSLRRLADRLGIASRCVWKGSLSQTEVLAEYRAADIFALASRVTDDGDRDGLPNVLVEAASQRLAVVSTKVSAIPELFTDGETALLVPPDDPQALADALERAIADPALRSRLGRAAEERVRVGFDHRSSVRFLATLFRGGHAIQ